MIYAVFYTNQNYIAQNLCENRNKPTLHCNGHCRLNKKLADDDTQQNSQVPAQKLANEMNVLFLRPAVFYPVIFQSKSVPSFNGYYNLFQPQTHAGSVFHPPALLV